MSALGTVATSFATSSNVFVTMNSSAVITTMMRVTPYPNLIPGSSLKYFSYSSISS